MGQGGVAGRGTEGQKEVASARVLEGQGPNSVGVGEAGSGLGGGVANGLSAPATLHEGFWGDPGSGQRWEMGWAWWALHELLLLGTGGP